MPNVHTPERLAIESREQYKQRRLASHALYRMSQAPRQAPFVPRADQPGLMPNPGAWWMGQHTDASKNAIRRAKKAAGGFRQYKKLRAEERHVARQYAEHRLREGLDA